MTELYMNLIDKYCQRYLESYVKCVEEFPDTWQLDCKKQKLKLAKCATMNPSISLIKSSCSKHFDMYEKCCKDNPDDVDRICMKYLHDFNRCAEQVITKEGIT